MRVTIRFDSATTEQVRAMSVALNGVLGNNRLTLGVEGPEHWHGETPPLRENQFAEVVGRLVKYKGQPLGDIAVTHTHDGGAPFSVLPGRVVCANTYAPVQSVRPCPHCDAAYVTEDGNCVHCGADRSSE